MDSFVAQKQNSPGDGDSDGSEHSVDSIHQRFQSDIFICITCKQTFGTKSKLKEHFKSGCQTICAACQAPMYTRLSPYGMEYGHECRRGKKQAVTRSEVPSQPLNNGGTS